MLLLRPETKYDWWIPLILRPCISLLLQIKQVIVIFVINKQFDFGLVVLKMNPWCGKVLFSVRRSCRCPRPWCCSRRRPRGSSGVDSLLPPWQYMLKINVEKLISAWMKWLFGKFHREINERYIYLFFIEIINCIFSLSHFQLVLNAHFYICSQWSHLKLQLFYYDITLQTVSWSSNTSRLSPIKKISWKF